MIAGIERLRHAREILNQAGQRASYVEGLIAATEECWSAVIDGTDWPIDLRVRATTLQNAAFRYGGIRTTVERMNANEMSRLSDELLQLIGAAERATGGP